LIEEQSFKYVVFLNWFLSELTRQHITARGSIAPHEDSVWLGGQDVSIEGTFVWTSSGGHRLSNDLRWGAGIVQLDSFNLQNNVVIRP